MSEEIARNEEREELVGAYVDNELTPQLRAQVEQWLAESADLRRLRDELLAMRTGMQQLPRHTLERDLSASVLERAERAVLAGRQQAVETRDRSVSSSARESRSSRRSLRMILWPALAVAAALAIAFFDTQQKPAERQVAEHAPRGETKIQAAPTNGRLAKEADESAGAAAETLSARDDKNEAGVTLAEPTDRPLSSTVGSAAKSVPMRSNFEPSPAAPPGEAGEMRERARRAERDVTAAAVLADADDNLVEVEVPPVVIQEQRLQKLLSSNSISWKPVDEEVALPQARSRMVQQEKNKRSNVADVQYFSVSATPEQVDELVNALKKQDSRVSRAQNVPSKDQALQQQQRKVEAAKLPRQSQVNDAKNLPPVTILLRSIDEPEKQEENK